MCIEINILYFHLNVWVVRSYCLSQKLHHLYSQWRNTEWSNICVGRITQLSTRETGNLGSVMKVKKCNWSCSRNKGEWAKSKLLLHSQEAFHIFQRTTIWSKFYTCHQVLRKRYFFFGIWHCTNHYPVNSSRTIPILQKSATDWEAKVSSPSNSK